MREPMKYDEFIALFKSRIANKWISQAELARKVGTSRTHINNAYKDRGGVSRELQLEIEKVLEIGDYKKSTEQTHAQPRERVTDDMAQAAIDIMEGGAALIDKLLRSVKDITNKREQVLNKTKTELGEIKNIMFMLPVGIAVVNPDMEFTYQNPKFKKYDIPGVPTDEPCGESCPTHACDNCRVKEAFETGMPQRMIRKELGIGVTATPIIKDGRVVEVLATVFDLWGDCPKDKEAE